MFKLFITCLVVLSFQANALELFNYKKASKMKTYTKAQVEQVWASNVPACLKDGSKLLGVNKAYKTAGLGYRDCSTSENAIKKQELTGVKVNVIKLTELPSDIAKEVLGIK